MTRMSFEQAAEIARRTGNTDHVNAHWNRTRVALLHEVIRDFLDDLPPGVDFATIARLEDSLGSLRATIDRMDGGMPA